MKVQAQGMIFALGLMSAAALASSAGAQTLTIGTGGPATIYQMFGDVICAPASKIDGLHCGTRQVSSWRQSLDDLASGEQNLALLGSDRLAEMVEVADEALIAAEAHAVLALPARSVTVLVRADSNIESMDGLKGLPVRTAPRKKIWPFLQWLRESGWRAEDVARFGELGYENSVNGVCDGSIAASIFLDGHPGELTRIATERCALRLISIDDDAVTGLLDTLPDLVRTRIPAQTYAGQTETAVSFGEYIALVARPEVDAEAVYQLVKALYEGYAEASAGVVPLSTWRREQLVRDTYPIPLHPGAERYVRELAGR